MINKLLSASAVSLVASLFACPVNAFVYSVDNGNLNNQIGFGVDVREFDLLWLNSFTIQTGGEVISSISVAYGTSNPTNDGVPTEVILFSDPNNNGNPDDAVVLQTAISQITNPGTGIFSVVPITPTNFAVGDGFFIGVLARNLVGGSLPAGIEQGSPILSNRSFFFASVAQGNNPLIPLNQNDLFNNNFAAGAVENLGAGFEGNWLIRANEPVTPIPFEFSPVLGLSVVGGLYGAKKVLQKFKKN
jgi:hypothetical protein